MDLRLVFDLVSLRFLGPRGKILWTFHLFTTLSTLAFLDVLEGQEAGESHFIRLYLSLLGLSLVHYIGLIFAALIYLYLIVFMIRKLVDLIFTVLFALLT